MLRISSLLGYSKMRERGVGKWKLRDSKPVGSTKHKMHPISAGVRETDHTNFCNEIGIKYTSCYVGLFLRHISESKVNS